MAPCGWHFATLPGFRDGEPAAPVTSTDCTSATSPVCCVTGSLFESAGGGHRFVGYDSAYDGLQDAATTVPGNTTPTTSGPDPSNADEDSDGTESSAGDPICPNEDEPNDEQEDAVELPETEDCDMPAEAAGSLWGDADVDWFYYRGADTFGCVVDPTRDVIASGEIRFCKFARCVRGASSIEACPAGTVNAATDAGDAGRCAAGGTTTNFSITPSCAGISDDVRVYMRVDQGAADVGTSYAASYHF